MSEAAIRLHIEPVEDGGYVATSPDVPGLVAEGRSLIEVAEIARDVARKIVESCREHGDPLPPALAGYDDSRPLETYLFSIAAHKLTDFLRREGRRPTLPLSAGSDSESQWDPPDRHRRASALAQSGERRRIESDVISRLLAEEVARWRERGDWTKLKCMELLIVRGAANKDAATLLGISEQQVANYKFDFLARLRTLVRRQGLSEDLFPELREDA